MRNLDDIYKNENNAFNFYYMSEDERTHAEELREGRKQKESRKQKEVTSQENKNQ